MSASRLALRQWAHVAGVFEEGRGITLYVNGEAAGAAQGAGAFEQATGADLWIGRNAEEMEQSGERRSAPAAADAHSAGRDPGRAEGDAPMP